MTNIRAGMCYLKRLFIFVSCVFITCVSGTDAARKSFCESFLHHYEFNPEGRYTHEYHPFLLDKTAESLAELEHTLTHAGFNLDGRIIIFGYEENAVPSYYTSYTKAKINDEAILKHRIGWSLRLHNRFGIMSGFLFKDFPLLSSRWFKNDDAPIEHVNADTIFVFNDKAAIFQEHAFGDSLDFMYHVQQALARKYYQKDMRGIWEDIVIFWKTLYERALKVSNKQVAGTQDILFSIAYAKHILMSKIPLVKMFIGPDLTYPIEISCKQEKGATLNAQTFVSIMTKRLKAINNEPTVYVFCSFVDGVGKSTMLGNIKNWMQHSDNIDQFGHVDNTSSQLIDLFSYAPQVYIADMPAQMSHFTYKPDGHVYVDIKSALSYDEIKDVQDFVHAHQEQIDQDAQALTKTVQDIVVHEGYESPALNDIRQASMWFIKNLLLFGKIHDHRWVPFAYKNNVYITQLTAPYETRILMSLDQVRSEGLKNIETEQMLFDKGIRFPLLYKDFLDYFVNQLKKQDIKHVVFVDFMSMYPRSSRENIRVNYLLQQQALLAPDFSVDQSLYRYFTSGGDLLYTLCDRDSCAKIEQSLVDETLIRYVLYDCIQKNRYATLSGISLADLTLLIRQELKMVPSQEEVFVNECVAHKCAREAESLNKIYGFSKAFVNISQCSMKRIIAFWQNLQDFFVRNIRHERINRLWEDCGSLRPDNQNSHDEGYCEKLLTTTSGEPLQAIYSLPLECKDEALLTPLLHALRAVAYASLSNLLFMNKVCRNYYACEYERFLVPSFFIKIGVDDRVYFTRKLFNEIKLEKPPMDQKTAILFNLPTAGSVQDYGEYNDQIYRLPWAARATNYGVYAFDCYVAKTKNEQQRASYPSIISLLVQKNQTEKGMATVMPTELIMQELAKSTWWQVQSEGMVKEALRNGFCNQQRPDPKKPDPKKNNQESQNQAILKPRQAPRRLCLGIKQQRSAARMMIRILATLEMVVKDPDSDIVVRYGNREDFKAALKLFEKITLPKYFDILFKDNLFKNYDRVEPYPSWAFWDKL